MTDPKIEERRTSAADALKRHLDTAPDSVILASIRDGKITVDVTSFETIPTMVMAAKILELYMEDTLKQTMTAQATQEGIAKLRELGTIA